MNLTQRNIAIALSVLLVGAAVYYFREIVTYVLISWVISMLGQPLMKVLKSRVRFGRKRLPPSVCALLTLSFFILIIMGIVGTFVPLIVQQANQLYAIDFQTFTQALEQPLSELTRLGHRFGLIKPEETVVEALQHSFYDMFGVVNVPDTFNSVFKTVGDLAIGLVSVMFISFFFLKENNMFTDFLVSITPADRENNMREAIGDTVTLLSRYFGGLLMQMFFVALFLSITLFILGIKNALLIGIFAAIINIVPYLGPILGCALALFITITSNLGQDFYAVIVPLMLKVGIVFGFMQFINDWVVQPLIFSNRVLAHPLEIFLVTLIGAKLGGVVGMILAIPTYTVARVVAREFFNQFRFVKKITKGLDESGIV